MTLEELKNSTEHQYKSIRRDEPNAPAVSLKDWRGFSPYAGGPTSFAEISYHLEGERVRVHKAFEGDYWYILS